MPETLVHEIWRRREFEHRHLETVSGQAVVVLDTGRHNRDAGPDFVNARIRIGATEWFGDVEIHRSSAEWLQHGHQTDARYNSVILHVVLIPDLWTGSLSRRDGTQRPEVALSSFLRRPLRGLLATIRADEGGSLPCEASWNRLPNGLVDSLMQDLGQARFARRVLSVGHQLADGDDLEQVLFVRVLAALGYAKNREPMAELARRLPLDQLRRLNTLADVEAALLGAAGLIPNDEISGEPDDRQYVEQLRARFSILSETMNVQPMRPEQWLFFRLRPSNFPPLRLAQAASLVARGALAGPSSVGHFRDIVLSAGRPLAALREALSISLPEFWLSHVRLERTSTHRRASLGRSRADRIILNAVLPVVAFSAGEPPNHEVLSRAREVVRAIPAEDDEVTRSYAAMGARPESAEESQGLHELSATLCSRAGCLGCRVGRFILSR